MSSEANTQIVGSHSGSIAASGALAPTVDSSVSSAPVSIPSTALASSIWEGIDGYEVFKAFQLIEGSTPGPSTSVSIASKLLYLFHAMRGEANGRRPPDTSHLSTILLFHYCFGPDFDFQPDIRAPDELRAKFSLAVFRHYYNQVRLGVVQVGRDPKNKVKVQEAFAWLVVLEGTMNVVGICKRVAGDVDFVVAVADFAAHTCEIWNELCVAHTAFDVTSSLLKACLQENLKELQAKAEILGPLLLRFCEYTESEAFRRAGPSDEITDLRIRQADFVWKTLCPPSHFAKGIRKVNRRVRDERKGDCVLYPDSCDFCLKEESSEIKLKRCSRCFVARYCSSECQVKDWKERNHKSKCRSSAN